MVNGNVSEEGIRADLAWMTRIGVGGAFVFDIGFQFPPVPQLVETRVGFGSRQWERAFGVAASEARRNGLSLGVQSSGGWSVSGGPQVSADDAMKKLVWSEAIVSAGSDGFELPVLPTVAGPFQDMPLSNKTTSDSQYGVIAAMAFPLESDSTTDDYSETDILSDGRYSATRSFSPDADGNVLIEAATGGNPIAARSLTLAVHGGFSGIAILNSSGCVIARLEVVEQNEAPVTTWSLLLPEEKYWTIRLEGVRAPIAVSEARLSHRLAIDRWQVKAGFGVRRDYSAIRDMVAGVDPQKVVNLSRRLKADGSMDWQPTRGQWQVLRFGWSNTGRVTVPATPESRGLEVDKLDTGAVRRFAESHFDRYLKASDAGNGPDMALTDSWEAGVQNWTPRLVEKFKKLRGYDPLPWFPALAGYPVGKAGESDRFLADWRRTLADVVAISHYATIGSVASQRGMTYFAEAPGTNLPTVADGIQSRRHIAVPTGEYWFGGAGAAPKPEHIADIREASSAAHLSGKRMIAAEALTSFGEEAWASGPREWRPTVDRFFAEGVNKIIMHTSVHQPFVDGKRPGITLRQYGQHFTRNETWAEMADGWVSYLARTSYLLQQGKPVNDIAVFVGEEGAIGTTIGFTRPEGFDFDFVDRETLHEIAIEEKALVSPSGHRYRILMLAPGVKALSVRTLQRIRAFQKAGVRIIGHRPDSPFGLSDSWPAFNRLSDEIWNHQEPVPKAFERREQSILPDLRFSQGRIEWTHRRSSNADIWFLANSEPSEWAGKLVLRDSVATNPIAEIWNAEDGSRRPVALVKKEDGLHIDFQLSPHASRFIVVREGRPKSENHDIVNTSMEVPLNGPWSLRFLDLPEPIDAGVQSTLVSWAQSADPRIRYYSGRARYSSNFELPPEMEGKPLTLDLGQVGEMARIHINGYDLGVVWWSPAKLTIPVGIVVPGHNKIEIDVANYWKNRLIGDLQNSAAPSAFTTINPFNKHDRLRVSGLIGPVVIHAEISNKENRQ